MFVVIAGQNDLSARALVHAWNEFDVALMTPRDLSEQGWRYKPGAGDGCTVVAGGRILAARDIRGIVTRLASVGEEELVNIVPQDRAYIAAEMTAVLQAWLSEIKVPVVNRPSSTCLSGPYWRREKWVHVAAHLGIRVRAAQRKAFLHRGKEESTDHPSTTSVTFAGRKCVGDVHPTLGHQAERLAHAAGVQLLALEFSRPDADAEFLGAHLWPDIAESAVANAILECFEKTPSTLIVSSG